MVCDWLVVPRICAKLRPGGDRVTLAGVPTPVSGTDCGLPGALSVTLTAALRLPVAIGVKVTLIVQLLFGCSDDGQLLVCPKSPLSAPVIWIDVMVSGKLPLFVRVVVWGLLLTPTV
jgi:hypothetical protein